MLICSILFQESVQTALHLAATNGHEKLVELLLAAEAEVNGTSWGVGDEAFYVHTILI